MRRLVSWGDCTVPSVNLLRIALLDDHVDRVDCARFRCETLFSEFPRCCCSRECLDLTHEIPLSLRRVTWNRSRFLLELRAFNACYSRSLDLQVRCHLLLFPVSIHRLTIVPVFADTDATAAASTILWNLPLSDSPKLYLWLLLRFELLFCLCICWRINDFICTWDRCTAWHSDPTDAALALRGVLLGDFLLTSNPRMIRRQYRRWEQRASCEVSAVWKILRDRASSFAVLHYEWELVNDLAARERRHTFAERRDRLSVVAHWFLWYTKVSVAPQLTRACGNTSAGSWHGRLVPRRGFWLDIVNRVSHCCSCSSRWSWSSSAIWIGKSLHES